MAKNQYRWKSLSSFLIAWSNICILIFLKKNNINIDSMKKINNFKNDVLKAERVKNAFEI